MKYFILWQLSLKCLLERENNTFSSCNLFTDDRGAAELEKPIKKYNTINI